MFKLSPGEKQQPLFAACSNLSASMIWAIDRVFCTFLHNPFIGCFVALVSLMCLQYYQLGSVIRMGEWAFLDTDVYFLDIFHNAVNLIFILRFVVYSQCLTLRSNFLIETTLLILQEFGVAVLLFYPNYSLLYSDISIVLRVFVWWQILCPYLILLFNALDSSGDAELEEKEKPQHITSSPGYSLFSVIVETNNNMLPVFMAHSFATINFEFPFYDGLFLPLIYHIAVISIKFYIIFRFVLYEIVVVVLNIPNLKSYAELYTPVQIGTPRKSWYSRISRYIPHVLIATTSICIFFDLAVILLAKYAS